MEPICMEMTINNQGSWWKGDFYSLSLLKAPEDIFWFVGPLSKPWRCWTGRGVGPNENDPWTVLCWKLEWTNFEK